MGKIKSLVISLIMILIGTSFVLTGCNQYRKLQVNFVQREVVVYLSDNPEENLFSLSAVVTGNKKKVSTDVSFDIHTTQGVIEQYGEVAKDGNKSTITYKALSKGKVDVYATTKEGGKTAVCTVDVKIPVTQVGFTQQSLIINRGTQKDFASFVDLKPGNTSEMDVALSVISADIIGEESKVLIDGTKVLVDSNSSLTSFVLKIASVERPEVENNITVNVIDTVNKIIVEGHNPNALENQYSQLNYENDAYVLNLAQNVDDSSRYKKLIRVRGLIQDGGASYDKGVIKQESDYEIRILKYNATTNSYGQISLPYYGDHIEISKQLSNGTYQIQQRSKGTERFRILVDYKDHVGEFTSQVDLVVNVQGLPTAINLKSGNKEITSATLFKFKETSSVQGTSVDLEVIGVGDEKLTEEPILISFETESGLEAKVNVKNKYGEIISDFTNPITVSNDSPLLISHYYDATDEIPTDLKMVFTSVNYTRVTKSIDLVINTSDVAIINLSSEVRISSDSTEGVELTVNYMDSNSEETVFDSRLLEIHIGNPNIVEVNQSILQTEGKIVLMPKALGETSLSLSSPNGIDSNITTIKVFEELSTESTIKLFDTTLVPTVVNTEVKDVVLKTHGTYKILYNINGKYTSTSQAGLNDALITTTSSVFNIVDGAIVTNRNVGEGLVNVQITGYDEAGEKVKTLTYTFNVVVKAQLVSATPNMYIETIYDRNEVLSHENTLAKRNIRFTVDPSNASFTAEDVSWVVKVGSIIIEPTFVREETVGNNKIITYIFDYNNNYIYIEVNPEDVKAATIYATLSDSSLVFNAICQIRQTFNDDKGVATTSVNEDVNVTFTLLHPTKVSSIVLNNVKQQSVTMSDGSTSVKNSYTFDTREMEADNIGTFISGNEYTINYSILPANATIQELSATHSQASSDLEVTVDNVNKKIKVKVNRQLDGETIIYIRSNDSLDSNIVEQQIYLKVANGTFKNPFEIENAKDFAKVNNSLSSHYKLVSDINLQSLTDYEPIGTFEHPFTGTFNGMDEIVLGNTTAYVQHTIYNLNLTREQGQESNNINYLGMFGYIGETGAVVNVNISGVQMNIMDSFSNQETYVGVIAGFSKGLIYNATVRDNSNIEKAGVSAMFEDSTRTPGINYRAMGSYKNVYVGGIAGMVVGMEDVTATFNDRSSIISGVTSNFQNNKVYMNMVATTTISTNTMAVGGLVGYNLGAKIFNTNNADYDSIVAVNTYPGVTMNNSNTVIGGLIGTNFGIVENYVVKTYVKGQAYTGGFVGANFGKIINNTVLPVVRGETYVGGLIAYNVHDSDINTSTLLKSMFPKVLTEENEISDKYSLTNNDFYNTYFTISGSNVLGKANTLVKDNKVQFVDNYNINFIENLGAKSVYNTAIIGKTYVGGLIGATYDYNTSKENPGTSITYTIEETIVNNSVFSYFTVGSSVEFGTAPNNVVRDRNINNYNGSDSDADERNKYYGDIILTSTESYGSVGGLIGIANHANIIKAFVNVNITVTANNVTQHIGGLVGTITGSGVVDAILRIVDSHTSGIINSQNPYVETTASTHANVIGSFVGDATNLDSKTFITTTRTYYGTDAVKFYNAQSSYSVLQQSLATNGYVASADLTFVDNFTGTNTTRNVEGQISGFDGSNYTYDNFTVVNSFYIGFKIKYLEKATVGGGFDMATHLETADFAKVKEFTFTYDEAITGYHQFDDGDRFYYYNLEYVSGNTIEYSNVKMGNYVQKREVVDGLEQITDITWINVHLTSLASGFVYSTYYVEDENALEDGFGVDTDSQDFGNGNEHAIESKYNWYHNVYEYENPVDNTQKYKAYNGLPIVMNLQPTLTISGSPVRTYDNQLRFVVDIPPMGIGVEYIEDGSKTFIRDIDGGKEILLTITELDSKYYNSDGTLTSFNNYPTNDKVSLSNEVKTNIEKENTYILSDVIDITALPRFVGSNKLEYRSVNGLVTFGYDNHGNVTMQLLGAGKDQIKITSLYNTDVTYVANLNIISKVSDIKILQNKRSTTEISTIDVVKNVETSFYADVNSVFNRIINSRSYNFDLTQRQNLGVRYYFTYNVGTRLSVLFDTPMAGSVEMLYALNGQEIVEEEIQIDTGSGLETKYIRYVDIASSEVSILGTEDFSEYSTILAVPYMILDNENFFKVSVNDVEDIANSYVQGASGVAGTFNLTHDLIKPLQIKIYNKTFGMQVDKSSVEFAAYIEPIVTVTLTTDNFNEELYYVVSNGLTDTGESSADDPAYSRQVTLENLQVLSYSPDVSAEAQANRRKTYQFKLNVTKVAGTYNTISNNETFTITFYTKDSSGNREFVRTINVTLLPQPVTNTSILHYPSSEYEEVMIDGVTTFIPKANEVAYNNIIPGYMGLLKVNLSPYYANVHNVVIESSVVDGKSIIFEQLVYEASALSDEYKYVTAYPQAETTSTGIIALKRSKVVGDAYVYDGNIYLRTILPTSVVSGSLFTITVTPYGYSNGELIAYRPQTVTLEAISPPGLDITYKGSRYGVVARGTDNTIDITGEGLEDTYIDFDKYTTLSIYNGVTESGVAGKIRLTKVSNNAYTLNVATDIPQGSTIKLVGYTEKIINDKLYTSRSELTLKVADFVIEKISVENVVDGVYQSTLNQTRLLRVQLAEVSYNPNIPGISKKLRDFTEEISTKLNSRDENATWYQRVYNLDGSFNDISLAEGDYGTFVIDVNDSGDMYLRNTVKNSTDVLVAKAIINYSFGTSPNIQLGEPNENTTPSATVDESFMVELECEFSFNVIRNTEDETPEPISTAEQFLSMEAGINYILTNDIVLNQYKPISTEITSLDGNGYVITIGSFDTSVETDEEGNVTTSTATLDLGLFSTVSDATILKNIVLEVVPLGAPYVVEETSNNSTQDLLIDATNYESINFGFIAATNNGIITNAQVVNDRLANEIRRERENMLDEYYDDAEYTKKTYSDVPNRSISVVKVATKADITTANIGGLVATNNGYISNSRVENITLNGVGYVAGVAVRNSGTISSTYYKGANLLNQSSELIESAGTAGLVVFNEDGATIQYCYTMSREGWSYTYNQTPEVIDSNMSGGKVTYYDVDLDSGLVTDDHTFTIGESSGQNYLEHRDITGLSQVDKDKFTGVYNSNTLSVSDGTNIIDLKTNTTIYQLAMIALLDTSDMFTLRAINSGINVNTDASGFVYENNGTISNSYANMLVNAAHSAGFVFTSGEDGIIEDCYSLSSVRVESHAHSPFTGKTLSNTESTYNAKVSNISYSHYLNINQSIKFTDEHDVPYTIIMRDKFYHDGEPATNLEAQELYSYNSFQGYAFNSDFELNVDILRNVWFIPSRINASSYDTYNVLKDNFKHSYYAPNRPELVSANLRTMSVRVLINDFETSTTLQYEYLPSLIIGESIRNPYLVYNAKTFNDYGTMSIRTESGEVNKNYIRFISDITFDGDSLNSIKAETYNTAFAGDIDGNGMTINELKLIAESNLESKEKIDHLGLFGKLYSFKVNDVLLGESTTYTAIVRNLNINVTSIDGTGVTYVGALAGEMIDAYAFNIKVLAEAGTYVNGQNAVGGVVGKISGNSELVNVNTNISVSATNKNTLAEGLFAVYDGTEATLKNISYAGGIAGIVDVNGRTNDVKTAQKYARIRKIDVYGSTTISGDIAGGIFGYIGTSSTASDVHFTITNDGTATPRIVSKYSAGGIVGELRGKIERSYIAHSNQTEINQELKDNINSTTHNSHLTKAYTRLFNSSSLAESYYIGGIAGMNIGGTISDSYTNVDVINGISQFAGGVIGMNMGGTVKSVYTTGSVYAKYVGGFIGLAVNGGMLEVCIPAGTYSVIDLQTEGLKISNIKVIVETKVDLSSLVANSIVSANVWRSEDLLKVNYDNIGSFLGKIIDRVDYNPDPEGAEPDIISTTSDSSRQMAEVNVFANATKTVNGRTLELKEIGARNNSCSYEISEVQYPTSYADIIEGSRYNKGSYGVVHKTESGSKFYYYSRFKKYGSLRTIEEIIARKTIGVIAKSYETSSVTTTDTSGDFVKYEVTKSHALPNIYKGWSAIYWEGTAVNNVGQADSDQVLPSLIARPNVAVVRVYGVEDLKLMYTLLGSEFVLMNDIDLSGEAWTPVGTDSDPFTGSIHSDYDSSNEYNSWTIKNVSIDSMDGNTVGFVGTASGATFNDFNLHLTGIEIKTSPQYEIHVGGLVGLLKDDNPSTVDNVVVFGGVETTQADAESYATTADDTILGIGTSDLYYKGSSTISATNIVSMGGVIGTSYQSNFTDIHAVNLHIKAVNAEDSSSDAGASGRDLAVNAMGGVVGYFINDKTITVENLSSKNVRIGDDDESVFRQSVYMGGLIGYGNSAYLRNSMATNFTVNEKISQYASEKPIYVGGIAGDFNGIVFDAVVINDNVSEFKYEADPDTVGVESYSNKIAVTIENDGENSGLYVGGAFGRLSKLYTAYDDTPIYIGSIPIRADDNPFGFIEMAGATATGHYKIPNISNAILVDANIAVTSDMSNKTSYIGGVIGYSNGPLYNMVTYGNMEVSVTNDAYVGGLVAHASNDFVQNAYSNRQITFVDSGSVAHTNVLYMGGAFGFVQNIGNMLDADSNSRAQNIVSGGNIKINTVLYKTAFVGGFAGKTLNVSLETSISNTNIVYGAKSSANKDSDAVSYIGGFVGYFEETSIEGEKPTIILNSYSTGSIALASNSYQNGGGVGGFVGYISVLSDKEMYSAPGVIKDSANITNCYTISRVIPVDGADCEASNEVKQDILQDTITKGGFVGAVNGESDILTNCYFNKEIFSSYENSTNELVVKRYTAGITYINYGTGLTLNDMLYTGGATTMSLTGKVYNRKNVVVTEPGNTNDLELWTFQANSYPTLKFYFESWQDNIYAVENPTLAIPTVLNYCYTNEMFDADEQNKYNITNLINGKNVVKNIVVSPNYDGVGGNIIGYDAQQVVDYVTTDVKTLDNPYGIQSVGTEQNPWFISVTANLAESNSGVYTYDFTNKAVVITTGATLTNEYGASSNTLVNSTIIFKDAVTVTSAKFSNVDVNSFIYGLVTDSAVSLDTKVVTNYGELKNFNIAKVNDSNAIITTNYGLINDIKVGGLANTVFIGTNNGIIDNIEYTSIGVKSTFNGEFVTTNAGYINGVFFNVDVSSTTIYDTDGVTQLETLDYSGFELVTNNTGLTTNYAVAVKLQNRATGDTSKSIYNMYYIYRGNTTGSYATYHTVGSTANMVIESDYRTSLSITNNTKAHAIDAFSSAGTTLMVNKHAEYTIPYDFGKHWIIITGINHNMPILRNQIKDNYYDLDIGDDYYFTVTDSAATTFDVDTADELASAGSAISNAGSGTYTINLTANINLANKVWIPVNVQSGVTVVFNGNGHEVTNISAIAVNSDVGFFGISKGKITVKDVLFKDGYVAGVGGYAVDKDAADQKVSIYAVYDYDVENGATVAERNYAVGSIIGRVYNASEHAVTLSRVGNQYVYVAGNNKTDSTSYYVAGLIGVANAKTIAIADSYVNSPFMYSCANMSAGLVNTANTTYEVYAYNTYVVNYDVVTGESSYVSTKVATLTSGSVTDGGTTYTTDANNYYLNATNTVDATKFITGATYDKLQTHILPTFNWGTNWVRVQEHNDGLPYNMFETEYWIVAGSTAVANTDYTKSGSNYTVLTNKGLAYISYLSNTGTVITGTVTLQADTTFDMSGKLWTPIAGATGASAFSGTFVGGANSVIANLSATHFFGYSGGSVVTTQDNSHIALFAKTNGATIKDVTINNAMITGESYVAGFVAEALNTKINNCVIDANSTVTGNNNVGGIVASLTTDSTESSGSRRKSVVSNSTNNARIFGKQNVGGIVGNMGRTVVEMCTNNGAVYTINTKTADVATNIGGIVGYSNYGSVYEVINNGEVNGYDAIYATGTTNVGGIIGKLETASSGNNQSQLINAINYATVNGADNDTTGLIVGNLKDASTTKGNVVMAYSDATKNIAGTASTSYIFIGNLNEASNGEYWGATSVVAEGGDLVTENSVWTKASGVLTMNYATPTDYEGCYVQTNTFEITDAKHYQYLNYLIHKRANYVYEQNYDKFDIDVVVNTYSVENKYKDNSAAYTFRGTFQSKTSGSQAVFSVGEGGTSSNNHGGLFGVLQYAIIKDIKVTTTSTGFGGTAFSNVGILAGTAYGSDSAQNTFNNVTIDSTATITGDTNTGAIVGVSTYSTFTNCVVTGVTVSGKIYAGGYVGSASNLTISGTNADTHKSSATVTASENYAGGIVGHIHTSTTINKVGFDGTATSNGQWGGGIAGYADSITISNCNVSGSVYAKSTTNSFSGGIAGEAKSSSITGNTFSGTAYGWQNVGGIVGYNNNFTSTVTGNTMNGNIYVYRDINNSAVDDNGRVSQGLDDFGFGYTLSHSGGGSVSSSNGVEVYYGELDVASHRTANAINYICGNNASNDGNTVNDASRITIQDHLVKYSLSISTSHDTDGTINLVKYVYNIHGTFAITAYRYEELYVTPVTPDGEWHNGSQISSTSKSDSASGTDWGVWSIGADWGGAYSDFTGDVPDCSYDFTGEW